MTQSIADKYWFRNKTVIIVPSVIAAVVAIVLLIVTIQ